MKDRGGGVCEKQSLNSTHTRTKSVTREKTASECAKLAQQGIERAKVANRVQHGIHKLVERRNSNVYLLFT